jgi:hypothetical protein
MNWYLLTRQTSEAGNSDQRTATILLNADAVQCFQQGPTSTRVYLRSGALDSIDVVETLEQIVAQAREAEASGQRE